MFLGSFGWAQQISFRFKGIVNHELTNKKIDAVQVEVLQGGSVIGKTNASNGKYVIVVPADLSQKVQVRFSKGGFISKYIELDFSSANEEDLPAGDFQPVQSLDISLFEKSPEVDFSFLDTEPVAKIGYDSNKMSLKLDNSYNGKMKLKIQNLLAKAEAEKGKNEQEYNEAIQNADAAYDSKSYQEALSFYEQAISIKPKEEHPAQRILEIDALLQAEKEAELADKQENQAYYNLIEAADNLRDAGELEKAIEKYDEALDLKDEQYPRDEIKKIETIVKYDKAIQQGDIFFGQKSYKTAQEKYKLAAKLKPSEQYPKDKLAEIEGFLKAEEEKEAVKKQYDDAIAAGDQLYDAESYEEAKAKYQEALTFESSSSYAKGRVTMCDEKIAEAKEEAERLAKIEELLASGNQLFGEEKYEAAKAPFSEVLTLDSENAEAKDKLAQIDSKLAELADAAAIEENYNQLMEEGNSSFGSDEFETALAKYQEAKGVKSTEEVGQKIAETQAKIEEVNANAELAAQEAEYQKHLSEGNGSFDSGDLTAALTSYQTAKGVKDTEEINQKISETQTKIAENQAAADKQSNYDNLMEEGESLLSTGDLASAKSKFEQASAVFPDEQLPKDKIAEIDDLVEKQGKDAQITALLEAGAGLMSSNQLPEAKSKFEQVLTLDSENQSAKDRIAEIDDLIASNAAAQEKEEKINSLLEEANGLLDGGFLAQAKEKYEEVLAEDSSNGIAIGKISQIDNQLADQAAEAELNEQYNAVLADAESKEGSGDLESALEFYQQASGLKPNETLPKEKITELSSAIAANQNEAEKLATFERLKSEGLELVSSENYQGAKTKFTEALSYKDDAEVQGLIEQMNEKLAEIADARDKQQQYDLAVLAGQNAESANLLEKAIEEYQKAATIKPEETLPGQKIAELQERLNELAADQGEKNEQYNAAMQEGNRLFDEKKYLEAIQEYNKAHTIKPEESEPVDKAALAQQKEQEENDDERRAYEKILSVAEKKIGDRNWTKAEELVNRAKSIHPEDPRPDELLLRISSLKEQEKEYNNLMSSAKTAFDSKQYDQALDAYKSARNIRPDEQEPKDKIAEIQEILNAVVEIDPNQVRFDELMEKGRLTETAERYEEALSFYQEASGVYPDNQRAKDKVSEMQQILDDAASSRNAEIAKKAEFDALVREADNLFAQKKFVPGAKQKYEEALALFPDNSYAKTQYELSIEEGRKQEEFLKEYNKILKVADRKFDEKNYEKSKELYQRAVGFNSTDSYPKQRLEEIDAILNPAFVQNAELEDLGDPFSGSQIDGGFVLAQAEEKRKQIKKSKVLKKDAQALAEIESINAEKTEDRTQTLNEIYQTLDKVTATTKDSDDARLRAIELIRLSEEERSTLERQNEMYERAENLSDQGTLDIITSEAALDYKEDERVYQENTADLSEIKIKEERMTSEKMKDKTADNYATDDKFKMVQAEVSEKNKIDQQIAYDNNESLVSAEGIVKSAQKKQADAQRFHSLNMDESIEKVKEKVIDDSAESKEKQFQSNQVFAAVVNEKEEMDLADYNSEMEKYLRNKQSISNEKEKIKDVQEKADLAMADKISQVKSQNEKANAQFQNNVLSDEAERLNTQKNLENSALAIADKAKSEEEKHVATTETVKDVNKSVQAKDKKLQDDLNEKAYSNSAKLRKVDNTLKPKLKAKNSLGEEYPEGVSQEIFTRKDDDGLVNTIITRRIVVVDGHADVYVRTQTSSAITYTKNGKPSLSHVWNKETQGPHLARNY